MADEGKLRKMLKELWEIILELKEEEEAKKMKKTKYPSFDLKEDEEAKKDLDKRIREMQNWYPTFDPAEDIPHYPDLDAYIHEWSGEGASSTAGGASSSTVPGGASSSAAIGGSSSVAVADIGSSSAVEAAFAHEWSGEGSSSTAGDASSSNTTGGASSSAAIGCASSSAIIDIGSSTAVDAGSCSSASERGSSVTFADVGTEGTEFHFQPSTSQSDIQGQGDVSAPTQESPQQSREEKKKAVAASGHLATGSVENVEGTVACGLLGINGSNPQIEGIIVDIRNLFEEEDRESNSEMLREDRFVYCTEPGLVCVEVLDAKIQRVKGYSGTEDLLSRYSHLLDCSGECDVYKGLSGSEKVVDKKYEASEAGNDLLNLKEQDQSENHIDLYGYVSLQDLTQNSNVSMNVCKKRIKKAKEQDGEEKLELMQKKNIQAEKAFGVMQLLANHLVELEDESRNLQVDHILLVEKADTELKLQLLISELESLMQSTSKELGIPEPLEDKMNDLLGGDTHHKGDAAFLFMGDSKERKAAAIWNSEGEHWMLYQMPNKSADLAKATDKERMGSSIALKTHILQKGLKLFWPAIIIGIPVALAAVYVVFAPTP